MIAAFAPPALLGQTNATVALAQDVVDLKAQLINLVAINARLTQDTNELHNRLGALEAAFHAHDLWEWAGAFELAVGEYDWTFRHLDPNSRQLDDAISLGYLFSRPA